MFARLVENKQFYIFSLVYVLLNAVLIYYEFFYLTALPIILAMLTIIFLRLDISYYLVIFMTPLAIPLYELYRGLEFDLSLPTEPILAVMTLAIILKSLKSKSVVSRKLAIHPVSIAIYFYLAWMLITTITSSLPLVSIKYFVSRLWFIIPFYFLAGMVFREPRHIERFFWLYLIPLIMVILYATIRLSQYGFDDDRASHFVMNPFYKDHTAYGAVLAMFFPVALGLALYKKYDNVKRLVALVVFALVTMAIVYSHTRAAWISIIGAFGVFLVLALKIRTRYLVLIGGIVFISLISYWPEIQIRLEQNRQDSGSGDLTEHVQSISNITNDASNLERINRWKSALRMFEERPFLGWGPGTYMFQYAPYQNPLEKTIISTNAGDMGNAHSEYLGPLADSGVLGTLTFLGVVLTTLVIGIRAYKQAKNLKIKYFAMVSLLGLITYYLHGFLNNFLDTDKASAPFWGFTAILVVIDLHLKHLPAEQ
ncbi:MAG: O-antigen ligase family protein [Bacteroidota bacterium]